MHVAMHDPKISSLQLHKNALSAEIIDISYRMHADEVPASDEEEINISVGDWVLVTYDAGMDIRRFFQKKNLLNSYIHKKILREYKKILTSSKNLMTSLS